MGEQLVQPAGDVGVLWLMAAIAVRPVRPRAVPPAGAFALRLWRGTLTTRAGQGFARRSAMNSRAMRRALSRMERTAASLVMVARDTPSMSSPTVSGASTLLPRNCSMNSGRSIEK